MAADPPAASSAPVRRDVAVASLLALGLVLASFLLQANIDLNLSDEGYLWYGARAVARGEIPLRDFQSYDPGRYYWLAVWLRVLDPGIIPLRIGCAAFHFLGVLCGILVLQRLSRAWYVLVPAGALLTLWIFPAFMMNHTVALIGVYVALLLVEHPSLGRHVAAGIFVGLAAFFGRNLGVYALVSLALLMTFVWWRLERGDVRWRVLAAASGVVLGYAPMLLMLALTPGFWRANVDNMRLLVEMGTTNLAKPMPWPWREPSAWGACVGVLFIAAPLFYAGAAGWLLVASPQAVRRRRVLLVSTLVGIPYLHYAFSRADIEHLAMAIHPLLLGVMALPFDTTAGRRRLGMGLVATLAAVSLVAAGRVSPFYERASAPPGRTCRCRSAAGRSGCPDRKRRSCRRSCDSTPRTCVPVKGFSSCRISAPVCTASSVGVRPSGRPTSSSRIQNGGSAG